MLGKSLCLIYVLLVSFQADALSNNKLIQNLKSRMHPLASSGSLIKSYTDHSQSYIYDQALAVIAFSKHGDKKSATSLLKALSHLQNPDGSLYFSYDLKGKSPYPAEGDLRYAGAISWVAMAAANFQHTFGSKEFLSFNTKVLNYLSTQIVPITLKGKVVHALRFNPTDLPKTSWNEFETSALEHNLDAYAAFMNFERLNSQKKWKNDVANLKGFIVEMWDNKRSHFWSGVDLNKSIINKQEHYLDNQSWGLLALDEKTFRELDTKAALSHNCETFLVSHEGITGFMDTRPLRGPAKHEFVWSEGTAGQILAMERFNKIHDDKVTCQDHEAKAFLENIKKMKKTDGGIAYATTTSNPDFSSSSSVAGTVWYYFASNHINPFQL